MKTITCVLVLAVAAGCGGGAQLLGGRDGSGTDGTFAPPPPDGAASERLPDTSAAAPLCGPLGTLTVPTVTGDVCSGKVANQAFRYALCTCTELVWVTSLTTDSFNSITGQRAANGSVGVDGYVVAAQSYHVGGSFWIAGEPKGSPALTIVTTASSSIDRDLRAGGGIRGQGLQTIGGDVFSEGDVTCLGMNVAGAIHVPAGSLVAGASAAKGIINEPVTVPRPCDCAAPALDTARAVATLAQANDNAATGVSPTALNTAMGPRVVDLPCGRYHFDQINARDLTLRLAGRASVAVAGDVTVAGAFTVTLAPGAELDLFVAGDMKLGAATAFGNPAEPARVRVYVAGASVVLPRGTAIGANIYAPGALVTAGGALEISGALFANRFSFTGAVTLHYDEAISGGRGCP